MLGLFRLVSIAVAVGLIALMLHAGEPGQPWWWLLAIPFGLWIVGPAVIPYWIARRVAERRPTIVLFAFVLLSTMWSTTAYHAAFFESRSSTAALVMVFVPLYQWCALALVLAIGGLVRAWSIRRDNMR